MASVVARVAIPVVAVTPRPKPRFYAEGLLPTKPSDRAPQNARILSRDISDALYAVRLADGEIVDDVAVEDILDYVSAFELERFELAEFREAGEALKAADAEEDRLAVEREQRKVMRKKMKALNMQRDESDESSSEDASSDPAGEVSHGRHGRARPTYTHLYHPKELKQTEDHMASHKIKRRRKRNPITGELMPLSDHGSDDERKSSSAGPSSNAATEKKRRRKRDPVTGELRPLSPRDEPESELPLQLEKGKRPRRRRHPLTGELMPLGWKYDPDAPTEKKSTSSRRAMDAMSPGMEKLSLSIEPRVKRVKLDFSASESESTSAEDGVQGLGITTLKEESPESSENAFIDADTAIRDQLDSETDDSVMSVKAMPTLLTQRGMLASQGASSQATNTRPEPGRNSMTTILHSSPPRDVTEEDLDEDDDLADDEWFIEAILAHHLSDPKTHAPEYGADAVMLYQVKWEGSEELTWEPISSFPDTSVVEDYEQRAGLRPMQASSQTKTNVIARRQTTSSSGTASQPTQVVELGDEDEFQVEAITAHHLSDPRTHGPGHGRAPVMLYQVKWVGHEELTWETAKSFGDLSFVNKYRRKVGLLPLNH